MNLYSRLARRISGATPTIALLTDFGTHDHYVAALRAVIHRINPTATVVDISHHVEPQAVRQAGYLLWAVYRYFPHGTIFLCVVDPGVGTSRRILGVRTSHYSFVAPDNMLLDFVLSEERGLESVEIPVSNNPFALPDDSSTFQGRDILAPVAAHRSNGVLFAKLGRPTILHPVTSPFLDIDREESVKGEIVHIDRFGNMITNLRCTDALVATERIKAILMKGRRIQHWANQYAGIRKGTPAMIVGSNKLVEIVVNSGSAAKKLNASVGDPLTLVRA